MTLYIILFFIALCTGMALSVYTFGTGGKRKHIFQNIYFSVEDTDGVGVLYTKTGEYSAVLKSKIRYRSIRRTLTAITISRIYSLPLRKHWAKDMPYTNRTSS